MALIAVKENLNSGRDPRCDVRFELNKSRRGVMSPCLALYFTCARKSVAEGKIAQAVVWKNFVRKALRLSQCADTHAVTVRRA